MRRPPEARSRCAVPAPWLLRACLAGRRRPRLTTTARGRSSSFLRFLVPNPIILIPPCMIGASAGRRRAGRIFFQDDPAPGRLLDFHRAGLAIYIMMPDARPRARQPAAAAARQARGPRRAIHDARAPAGGAAPPACICCLPADSTIISAARMITTYHPGKRQRACLQQPQRT